MFLSARKSIDSVVWCPSSYSSSSSSDKEKNPKESNKYQSAKEILFGLLDHLNSADLNDAIIFSELEKKIDNVNMSKQEWRHLSKAMVKKLKQMNDAKIHINSVVENSEPNEEIIVSDEVFELRNNKGGDHEDKQYIKKKNLWDKEKPAIPFDVGIKLLEGNLNEDEIGDETKKEIASIEEQANKIAMRRMMKNRNYDKLFAEKEHWKYLAKTRLIELEKEIDFRYELVFGPSKKNV